MCGLVLAAPGLKVSVDSRLPGGQGDAHCLCVTMMGPYGSRTLRGDQFCRALWRGKLGMGICRS